MPKWGVDIRQFPLGTPTPWGLPIDLLRPAKTITDPVHGDIYVTRLEQLLIDSPPLQRLRRVRQLGTTHLVYPGATHSRFSHALGTMRAAQDLIDAVIDNRQGPRYQPDLLDEWDKQNELRLRLAEATVLARLGGLLHDLCHVPLGHTIEDDLKVLLPHDENEERFDSLWAALDPEARIAIETGKGACDPDAELRLEVRNLIMSKVGKNSWTSIYPFVEDIVGNTICADLMDYLSRDHHHTGLPLSLGHRFANDFYVMGSGHVHYARKMVIRISRHGQSRPDITTELLKYLRYRYELTERVLTHHAKTSADAMIGKLLEMWSDAEWLAAAAKAHPTIPAAQAKDIGLARAGVATTTSDTVMVERHRGEIEPVNKAVDGIDQVVHQVLEAEFTSRSDDGLLEYLTDRGSQPSADERWRAIGTLAKSVLDRQLFKTAARASGGADLAVAKETHKKFGSPSERRRLEKQAADAAGVSYGWSVVIWLPDPKMRLKVAEVLVDDGNGVAPLDRVSEASRQIVKAHEELWTVSVYVDPTVQREQPARVRAMLSHLRSSMQIAFVDNDGNPVPERHELMLDLVAAHGHLSGPDRDKLAQLTSDYTLAAAGSSVSVRTNFGALWAQAHAEGLVANENPPEWASEPTP